MWKPEDYAGFARRILGDISFVAADVGARGGVPAPWRGLENVALLVCIDGDEVACEELLRKVEDRGLRLSYTIIAATLTKTGGPRTLYRTNSKSASSLFNPDQPLTRAYVDHSHIFPLATQEIQTRAAAEVFREADLYRIDLLKLDVQGCELEILEALSDQQILEQTVCVETETAWQDKGLHYPQFQDIDSFVKDQGFELFDLRPVHAHRTLNGSRTAFQTSVFGVHRNSPSVSPRLREADALYFRSTDLLLRRGGSQEIRRAIVAYGVYGFFAEGYNLATEAATAGVLSQQDGAALRETLVQWHGATRHRWRHGSGALAAQVRWWLRKLGLREVSNW